MMKLSHSLAIEATKDPNFSGFYSPNLEGFTDVANSTEDCFYTSGWRMEEHFALLREQSLPVPSPAVEPKMVI